MEEYKESGIDWIGKIPKKWEIQPLGVCFEERREKVSDNDYEPLSVTKNGIVRQLENPTHMMIEKKCVKMIL